VFECAVRKAQGNGEDLQLNGTLIYAADVNLFGENINIIK
jgi:hypothetical protein